MKEYTTLKVSPSQEVSTIKSLGRFGWELEETREVYNESQEIVGINESSKATVYGNGVVGGFLQGFTGNDGKVESKVNVQTRTNVTHFLSMRFSRETSSVNYEKLKALEEEYNKLYPKYKQKVTMTKSPVFTTFIAIMALIFVAFSLVRVFMGAATPEIWEMVVYVVVLIMAVMIPILMWKRYHNKHKKEVAENAEIEKCNTKAKEDYDKRRTEIEKEAEKLVEENSRAK